jgi:hypothetical protein
VLLFEPSSCEKPEKGNALFGLESPNFPSRAKLQRSVWSLSYVCYLTFHGRSLVKLHFVDEKNARPILRQADRYRSGIFFVVEWLSVPMCGWYRTSEPAQLEIQNAREDEKRECRQQAERSFL